jgi:hypothetical protein
MPSQERSALRGTFIACAPKTVAGLTAASPGIDFTAVDALAGTVSS